MTSQISETLEHDSIPLDFWKKNKNFFVYMHPSLEYGDYWLIVLAGLQGSLYDINAWHLSAGWSSNRVGLASAGICLLADTQLDHWEIDV